MLTVESLASQAHTNARLQGFWDEGIDSLSLKLLLIQTEIAEAVDADREGDLIHRAEECADVIIRMGDFIGATMIPVSFFFDVTDIHEIGESARNDPLPEDGAFWMICAEVMNSISGASTAYEEGVKQLGAALIMQAFGWWVVGCYGLGIDLEAEVIKKMHKNTSRPRLHGKQY